ncbi:M64 family metallopeptidase [Streptosporangium amethystogenes]|uniref:M64 family metallopeptidase n=1 Tax=Streptosporangium amethystogenes TaxID=2002 RepID=UPI0037AB3F88
MIARPVSVREGPKSPIALGDVDLNVNARNVLGTPNSTPASALRGGRGRALDSDSFRTPRRHPASTRWWRWATAPSTAVRGTARAANVSKYTAAQLTSGKRKWYQYLGQATPDGGVIGAYQGGYDYAYGIYRPSENSIMRTLGKKFNLIGLDAMTKAILAKTG